MDEVALHASFAPAPAGGVVLGPREVHVWAVPLHGDPAAFGELLSGAERDRLAKFRFADHQRRYQIGHGALRAVLAGYLAADPRALEFQQGPRGKPFLVQPGPFFNLSHSGKLALIGVAQVELGLDLEKVRQLDGLVDIARRHFSEGEFAALDRLEGDARQLAFYRCWTRKEAYIKALGEGLSMALDTFDVSLCENPELVRCRDDGENPKDWSMLDVSPGPDFVAAAALRGKDVVVRRFRVAVA
jgi:4'-phosphopantetheinyl transferase